MRWTPDTHPISFDIENGTVSFISDDEKYVGRDPQEVYDEVVAEHKKVNESGMKDKLENGEVTLESILE